MPPGSALAALGIGTQGLGAGPSALPQAEQAALGKCSAIEQDFTNAVQNGPLAGIGTLSNDLYNDVEKDDAVSGATRAWKACMARNGYSFTQPGAVFFQELRTMYGGGHITPGQPVSAAANQAQIATAVTDADCTQSADLAGIYFAVQASYEQQFVSANRQALDAGVREYKAAFATALKAMPALLQTAPATLNLSGPAAGHHGKHGGAAKPSPSHS
jgi:hypothetical protein